MFLLKTLEQIIFPQSCVYLVQFKDLYLQQDILRPQKWLLSMNRTCQKAEVHVHFTQRKKKRNTGIIFLSGKMFCSNVEINAIDLTAVVNSKLYLSF